MVERWIVTVYCEYPKSGKVEQHDFVVEGDLYDATRIITTYKPKRGWEKFSFRVEKGVGLV
jgi:hypothetical protein